MPWKVPDRSVLKHLHNYMIVETEISISSIEEQRYAIQKFNELSFSFDKIIELLKKEIERRQERYNYYRDRLLNFKVKE